MDIRRHIMGLFGIAFLLGYVGLMFVKGSSDSQWSMFASICMRVGLMLGAIWLAFPQVIGIGKRLRFPPWMIAALGVSGLVVAARPRMVVYLVPVLGAIAVLQFFGWLFKPLPNPKRKPKAKTASKNDR